MSDFIYFLTSLPALHADGPLPHGGFAGYVARCRAMLSAEEAEGIAMLRLSPQVDMPADLPTPIADWFGFETELRNAGIRCLARIRRNQEATEWLRPVNQRYAWLEKAVEAILTTGNAYDQELALQKLRWDFLDDMASGHQFDYTMAVIYGLRLVILEKLAKYDAKLGKARFDMNLEQHTNIKLADRD